MQETNTWSPLPCRMADFESQGLEAGADILWKFEGTNTEVAGAIEAARDLGMTPVPLVRAWASSSGRLTADTLASLQSLLVEQIKTSNVDGIVLSLHGAMAAEGCDDADEALARAAREVVGAGVPLVVCLDLHANVTAGLAAVADVVIGYRTYPHTDQAETGRRAAVLVARLLQGERLTTVVAKRPMLVPAESQSTSSGPLGNLRAAADALEADPIADISLFPVQPWLDVEELGFGVTVTTSADRDRARQIAERLAESAWDARKDFTVELVAPNEAIDRAKAAHVRPFLLSESADSPTAGAGADSPAMVREFLARDNGLRAYVTLVDEAAVARCFEAGVGAVVRTPVGATIDGRFHEPVLLDATVERLGSHPVVLTGPSFTGMEVSMGRWVVVSRGNLSVLITERPAFTADPETFRHVGLDPSIADIVVVRSATLYKAAYPEHSVEAALTLDLPGASTARLDLLDFERAPRPLFPVDEFDRC